jgi:hypothetical protein
LVLSRSCILQTAQWNIRCLLCLEPLTKLNNASSSRSETAAAADKQVCTVYGGLNTCFLASPWGRLAAMPLAVAVPCIRQHRVGAVRLPSHCLDLLVVGDHHTPARDAGCPAPNNQPHHPKAFWPLELGCRG